MLHHSIDWFKGKITGTSYISWENLWFPLDFPLSQPIEGKDRQIPLLMDEDNRLYIGKYNPLQSSTNKGFEHCSEAMLCFVAFWEFQQKQ